MMRFYTALTVFVLTLAIILSLAGCQQAPEPEMTFGQEEADLMLNCCLDVTGSFQQEMLGTDNGQEGRAFKTFLRVRDRFFKDREQSKDRFIITRIAGSKKALLLDAIPQSFQERFPDAKSFRNFILSVPDPGGSRVYDSLRDSIDYMILQHRNAPKLKSMILIWSDMDDNRPDFGPEKSKQMLIDSLREYAALGGTIGIYGCELSAAPEWGRLLKDCNFRHFIVEADIRDNPKLPIFE